MKFEIEFIEFMPDLIQEKVIYISMTYGTVIHKCACGCGNEVNTPLGPNEWHLKYNGDVISLYPSVGNWSFPCKSHYWIKKSKIIWTSSWDNDFIEHKRKMETKNRVDFYSNNQSELNIINLKDGAKKEVEKIWYLRLFDWI